MTSATEMAVASPERDLIKAIIDPIDQVNDIDRICDTLVEKFGSLGRVLSASPETIRAAPDMPEAIVARIGHIRDVFLHVLRTDAYTRNSISTNEELKKYMRFKLRHLEREYFFVFYMNSRNEILKEEVLGVGTVNHVGVYPREIIRTALFVNATALILVHNHPSGSSLPSRDDVDFTRELNQLCGRLELTLHDHLIIGLDGETSLRQSALF